MKRFIVMFIFLLTLVLGVSFFAGLASGGDSNCRSSRKHPRFLRYMGSVMAFDMGCYLGEEVD